MPHEAVQKKHHMKYNLQTIHQKNECGLDRAEILIARPIGLRRLSIPAYGSNQHIETEFKQVVDSLTDSPIGSPVSSRYRLIPHSDIVDSVYSGVAGTDNKVVSAGLYAGHSKGYLTIKVGDEFLAGGRRTHGYVQVLFGHGGASTVKCVNSFIVINCSNQIRRIERNEPGFFNLRHSGRANASFLSRALDSSIGVAALFQREMDELAAAPCTRVDAERIIASQVVATGRVSREAASEWKHISALFQAGIDNKGETLLDLYNAATQYHTYQGTSLLSEAEAFERSELGLGCTRKVEWHQVLTSPVSVDARRFHGDSAITKLLQAVN